MSYFTVFTYMPYAFFALTMATFVLPLRLKVRAQAIWAMALLLCFSKFLCFNAFGGHPFNPDLPAAIIWTWDWLYSGAMILSALGLFTVFFRFRAKAWLLPLIAWGLSAWGLYNGLRVPDVHEVELEYADLPPSLDGYRIVQIADLHCSSAAQRGRTEAVVAKANALNADLICLTGDLADGKVGRIARHLEPIKELRAKDGVFACTGNHEYYHDYYAWMSQFYAKVSNIRFLTNECVFPCAGLALAGVPDEAGCGLGLDSVPDPRMAFAAATNGEFRVLLQHRPKGAVENVRELGVRLQLSGHAHGGIAPPFRPIIAFLNGGFVRGLYSLGKSYLYVSPGSGQWGGFPMRLFNDSEITVLTLRRKGSGKTIALEPGDGNMTPRVAEAIRTMKDGDTLRFASGEYHFYEEGTVRRELVTLSGKGGMKNVVFSLDGLKDITIDGGGAHFVWHGRVFPFAFTGCQGVSLRNLAASANRPSYVELAVTAADRESFTCAFAEGTDYRIEDGRLLVETDLGTFRSDRNEISLHAINELDIHYLFVANDTTPRDHLPATFLECRAEDLGGGRVRFRYLPGERPGKLAAVPFRVGEPLGALLNQRERCNVFFGSCADVRVDDVTLDAGDGMGFVGVLTENLRLRRCRVVPQPGRHVSITADCVYLVNCRGAVEVDGCELAWSMDDAVNIHGEYQRVTAVTGRCVRVERIQRSAGYTEKDLAFTPHHVGDRVEFSDGVTHDVLGEAAVAAIRLVPFGAELTLDRDVPSGVAAGALVENLTWVPDVRIRGSYVHDAMHLRLSGRGRYVVEGNRFERGTGLLVSDLSSYWGEAGRTADMTIRGNDFIGFASRGGYADITAEVEGRGANAPRIHRGIRILDNRYWPADCVFTNLPCALDPVVQGNAPLTR